MATTTTPAPQRRRLPLPLRACSHSWCRQRRRPHKHHRCRWIRLVQCRLRPEHSRRRPSRHIRPSRAGRSRRCKTRRQWGPAQRGGCCRRAHKVWLCFGVEKKYVERGGCCRHAHKVWLCFGVEK
eukprot:365261-Chlamydomonas_euryale.AAC.1